MVTNLFEGLYPPYFFKIKQFFGFLMFFGTLNHGESPYAIYFCRLELYASIFHHKIDSLGEYSLATDIATTYTCFKSQY